MFGIGAGIETGLSIIGKIRDLWKRGSDSNNDSGIMAKSYVDYTQAARVEPIVLIDTDCLYLDSISEVQQSLLSIFAGYYLQAVAISTTVGKVNVLRNLDRLNPSRSASGNAANVGMGWLLAQESYKHKLPVYNEEMSLEAMDRELEERDDRLSASGIGFARDTTRELKELANLSVGKLFIVEITDGLHKASIPITIRLMASSLPSANLIHILSIGNKDNSVKERYHAWRAGRLEFIKDLIFCQDLIDAHRKNLMTDKDGIYTNILKRARSNQVSAIVSANPSIATVSNLVILSNTTAEQLELHLDGKLSDFKTREKMMDTTYIMILCVIDKQWNRVTFYHRGMHLPTEVSVKDLKAANKGNGPDVSDILKAYQVGNQVSI